MFRGAFSKILAPGYRKVVFETYKERPTEGDMLVNMSTADRAYLEDFPIAGFGTLQRKPEGGSVVYQDAKEGSKVRYTWSTYGLGFIITMEMAEDDLYGVMGGKMSRALGRSARNNFEIIAHAPYNNGFDTAYTGFDGQPLFSTAHVNIKGGTQSNRHPTDADFDILSLQTALEHFHGLTDEAGLPVVFIPRMIVHSIGDYWMVNQVLKTDKLPGGNQNDINQVANEGLMAHLSHYLTDSDMWCVLADNYDINYFDRRKPTFTNSDDPHTGDALFRLTRRNGSGFGDWRGVYGSQGS